MHAKSANFGKICFLCILKGVKNAVREYISRISCPEGPLFPSGALKSCTMGKFCHSFVIPPSARRGGWRTTSVVSLSRRCKPHEANPEAQALRSPFMGVQTLWLVLCAECQSGNESYRAGKAITNTAPPSGALNAVTVPSKLSTISFTMAKPRPAPPLLRAREVSLR